MQHRHRGQHPGHSHHRRRKQGFSRPLSRQWYNLLGIRRDQKREFFNMLSRCIIWSFAVMGGIAGLALFGWLGVLPLTFAGALFGAWFVERDGMFR